MRIPCAVACLIFICIMSSIPSISSYERYLGGSTLEPFDEDRYGLPADAGDYARLFFNASQSPVECALYILENNEQLGLVDFLDLTSLLQIYSRTAVEDEFELTVSHEWGFVLVVWNLANITQRFDYDWYLVGANEDTWQSTLIYSLPAIPIVAVAVSLVVLRWRHRKLVAKEKQQ